MVLTANEIDKSIGKSEDLQHGRSKSLLAQTIAQDLNQQGHRSRLEPADRVPAERKLTFQFKLRRQRIYALVDTNSLSNNPEFAYTMTLQQQEKYAKEVAGCAIWLVIETINMYYSIANEGYECANLEGVAEEIIFQCPI